MKELQVRCTNCKAVFSSKKECIEDNNIQPAFLRYRCPICKHNVVSDVPIIYYTKKRK
jgi:ribosomal protein S27E